MTNIDSVSSTAALREEVKIAKRQAKLARLRFRAAKRKFKEAKRNAKCLKHKLKRLEAESSSAAKREGNPKARRKPGGKAATKHANAALELRLTRVQTRAALQ